MKSLKWFLYFKLRRFIPRRVYAASWTFHPAHHRTRGYEYNPHENGWVLTGELGRLEFYFAVEEDENAHFLLDWAQADEKDGFT